jgi:ferredoxin-nitrite reductase
MSVTNNTTDESSAAFTAEQKEYLQGFFAGAAQRGALPYVGQTSAGLITSDPSAGGRNLAAPEAAEALQQEDLWYGAPVEDLSKEERFKYEENPLDIWDKLVAHANENRAPSDADRFRIKYFGLFYVAPAQDSFMLRLRTPGGVMTTRQMRGLAEMAEDWGSGRLDLTTRSNVQIRQLLPKDIIRVLAKIQSLGMTSRGTGADNIRNITASPLAGLDPAELYDVRPLADALQLYITNSRDMFTLPRKFNVAFDGGGQVSVVADTNDIGFVAVRVKDGNGIPPGVYFRVLLCGITGHRQFASDCGLLLRPDQAVAVTAAMIRVFIAHGDRTDRKKARLKYLVDRWGVEKFLEETEKRLAFPLIRVPASQCEPRGPVDRKAHLGVHPQQQAGLNYIGLSIPVGRLPVEQARAIAQVADQYGSGEVRFTVWQNLLIPNIASANIAAAQEALAAANLAWEAGTVLSGTVACTGSQGCRFAATDTKKHAVELANYIDSRFQIDQPLNLHVTGCHNSCAQHYIGDIGMMGIKVSGEEGYQVMIGGGSDHEQGMGRELIPAVRVTELPEKMEALFSSFATRRSPGESFLEFSRRHPIEDLQGFCAGPAAPAQEGH